LTASAYVFGRPPTRTEEARIGRNSSRRLLISLQTAAATDFVLSGMGNLAHWLPSLSEAIRFWLSCR